MDEDARDNTAKPILERFLQGRHLAPHAREALVTQPFVDIDLEDEGLDAG